MAKMPTLTARQVIRAFGTFGWVEARQSGGHIILIRDGHLASLSVPNHAEVAKGTLRALIRAAGLTQDEFLAAVK